MTLTDIESFEDVYDKQVQEVLQEYLDGVTIPEDAEFETPEAQEQALDQAAHKTETMRVQAIETAIKIHAKRRTQMIGLYNRMRLEPASKFEWTEPRNADGVPIFARSSPGSTKINHKLHTPFDRSIMGSKSSYFVGIPPEISIASDQEVNEAEETLGKHLVRLGFCAKMTELSQRSTGRGTSFMLLSTPPGEDDIYAILPYEWTCIVIYDHITSKPVWAIRYWMDIEKGETKRDGNEESSEIITAELYDDELKRMYIGTTDSMAYQPEMDVQHMLEYIPLIEFANNTERIGDVELTLSLQDAFDVADSDLSSEISQLRLAYLALIGDIGGDIDDDWLEKLIKTGVLTIEEGEVKFLEKTLNSQAVEDLKEDLESRIYKYSNSYNPDELGADSTMTAYQIRRKLFRLESATKEAETQFSVGLLQMIKIISEFYNLGIESDQVDISFTRNLPRNMTQDLQDMVMAGYKVSQRRMATISPLGIDQDLNEEELAEETPSLPLGFGDGTTPPGSEEEEEEPQEMQDEPGPNDEDETE